MAADRALSLRNVDVSYGKVSAVRDLSLDVDAGEIVALLGPNGAGKSSTLKAISSIIAVKRGAIHSFGSDITTRAPDAIVRHGVSHVPEGRQIFPSLSVRDNLALGGYTKRKQVASLIDEVFALFPRLLEREAQSAGTLSGGEQQMLSIGRAMMAKPRLLLLDEPSMGLAPVLVDTVMDSIRRIAAGGVGVLLVEQNARVTLELADRVYVLSSGDLVAEGASSDIANSDILAKAYLGSFAETSSNSAGPEISETRPTTDGVADE